MWIIWVDNIHKGPPGHFIKLFYRIIVIIFLKTMFVNIWCFMEDKVAKRHNM
nr:MAG TPA: hypothetical protein [Caudoviricetes sp.]